MALWSIRQPRARPDPEQACEADAASMSENPDQPS